MSKDNEDRWFKKVLSETRTDMPFPDFENEVMMKIEELEAGEELIREGYRRGVAYSWFFFAVGIILGALLISWIPHFDIGFPGVDPGSFLILFQVGFILFILFHFEKLISMTRAKFYNRGDSEITEIH